MGQPGGKWGLLYALKYGQRNVKEDREGGHRRSLVLPSSRTDRTRKGGSGLQLNS